jgi:SAM-dependent methyltransferase
LSIRRSTQYEEILQRIKDGGKYLDIGCCVGQDIRKLVYDGAPAENLYGSDLMQDFLDIGYDLFLDKDTLNATFIAADIFDPGPNLKQLNGTIDIVHAASFFHLFGYQQQVVAAKQIVALMKPKAGGVIVGQQIGNVNAGERRRDTDQTKSRFSHDIKSFAKMWEEVGDETGTKWEVEARLLPLDVARNYTGSNHYTGVGLPEGTRWMTFSVRRV